MYYDLWIKESFLDFKESFWFSRSECLKLINAMKCVFFMKFVSKVMYEALEYISLGCHTKFYILFVVKNWKKCSFSFLKANGCKWSKMISRQLC